MDDLISRQMAIDAMANTLWHYPTECYRNLNEYEFAKGLAELGLKSVPSAQPQMIHCLECKHWEGEYRNGFWYFEQCSLNEHVASSDDFCSWAERKGE